MGADRDAEWVALYQNEGLTSVAIARRAHVRVSTVSRVLIDADVLDQHGRSAQTRRGRRPHVWAPSRWRPDLPATTIAYIAGLIDGEGCISHQRMRYAGWRLDVSQLTETGLVAWLIEQTGVGIQQTNRQRAGMRPVSAWRVARLAEVLDVLTATLPYLRVKKARATEALTDLRLRLKEE